RLSKKKERIDDRVISVYKLDHNTGRHQRRVRGPSSSGAMYFSHHGTNGHNTADCRATNSNPNSTSTTATTTGHHSGALEQPVTIPHMHELTQRAMHMNLNHPDAHHHPYSQRSPPRSHVDESPNLLFPFVQDEDLPSLLLLLLHLQPFHGKSNITINDEPAPLNDHTYSIIIPVTFQNYKCWAYVDSGSKCSSFKPSLASKSGLTLSLRTPIALNKSSLLQSKNHTISLGDADSSIERFGFIENVHLFYNNLNIHHTFEVFNLNSEADVCIGTDLMSKMNINITGLTTTWDEHSLPTIEDPIDSLPNTPTYKYYGSIAERSTFLQSLEIVLHSNASIDPKSVCTVPNSEVTLHFPENTVIFRKQYPLPLAYKSKLNEQIEAWLEKETITLADANTPHYNPILFAKKRDIAGNYGSEFRICADMRFLNQNLIASKSDAFSLPRIDEIHEQLSHCSIFTVLDLKSCFTRFAIAKESQPFTAFTTHTGQYVFRKRCFGIKTVPSFVQRIISNLFRDLPTVFAYIDDITIGTHKTDLVAHATLVKEVITRLNQAGLILQSKKCHFLLTSLTLLGFRLSSKGLQIDSSKICNLDQLPPITNNKALMRVLGLFNFFRRHIPNYVSISAPLDKLPSISDKRIFAQTWNSTHDSAYTALKYAITHVPVISVMDTSLPLRSNTDASKYAIGGFVWQLDQQNIVRFLGFASRSKIASERNYSVNKSAYLAIAYMFQRYHSWLRLAPFLLFTDHYSLKFLHSQRYCSPLLQNWCTTIYS
ncbi:hypothetical protein INT47_009734, partial [Mucor saturninus]